MSALTRRFPKTRYIPEGSKARIVPGLDAVVYICPVGQNNRPVAIAYSGKRNDPDWHLSFRTLEQMEQHIGKYFAGIQAGQEQKAAWRDEKKAYVHDFVVGDILHGSWGYDQTNCEFAEVVQVKGAVIWIRELAQKSAGATGHDSERRMPVKGQYESEPKRCVPQKGGYVRLHGSCTLSRWDGTPKYASWGH